MLFFQKESSYSSQFRLQFIEQLIEQLLQLVQQLIHFFLLLSVVLLSYSDTETLVTL